MPLDETWMVQWSRFFEINETKPNFSRRIGPYLSDGLGNDQIFPAFDETEGLACSTVTCSAPGSPACGRWTR